MTTTHSDKTKYIEGLGTLIETADGSWTLKHEGHGQDFHSSEGARFEAWNLYVIASGLWTRLQSSNSKSPEIHVLDVGMGLGYNACAAIAAWYESPNSPDMTLLSLEIDARLVQLLCGGTAPWCSGWTEAWLFGPRHLGVAPQDPDYAFCAVITHPKTSRTLTWHVKIGDASKTPLPNHPPFHFIWQDPFTPELNPSMWSSEWFEHILNHCSEQPVLMTYSVSRIVKDALHAGGWQHERFRTPGKKRHWLKATRP